MNKLFSKLLILIFAIPIISCNSTEGGQNIPDNSSASDTLILEGEKHFSNVKQLTFGGDNAEAYFSFDNKNLIFQATNEAWSASCDQIFTMPISGTNGSFPSRLSTGLGRTTCSYFFPDNQRILYASTHLADSLCPESPRLHNGKYVWAIYPSFEIFIANLKGEIIGQLTDNPGYDAEATIAPDGSKIVFTSTRSGDLELFTMDLDGTNVLQITNELGYDGGAFFSPDSKKLIFRASRPKTDEEKQNYSELLANGLVQPTEMELFTCNADGSDMKQITHLGKANWAPFFHPSGQKILFSSNHHSESGRLFNIFMINADGTGLEQVSFDQTFDAFPMFSFDGKKLVFSSNRFNGGTRDTNVFIADWKE